MSAPVEPASRRADFTLVRDGALLCGIEDRAGPLPLVFQHGLGASAAQVDETLGTLAGVRRLTLDCRAQGRSGAGPGLPFSIETFAADVLAACDARGVGSFVAGGLSMGAAVALHLAVRHPDRVRGLILARPAWAFEPSPDNLAPYGALASALRSQPDAAAVRAAFLDSAAARQLGAEEPAALAALLELSRSPHPHLTATLLGDIAAGGAGVTRAEVENLGLPTLILGQNRDPLHPLALAARLGRAIPGAQLVEVPPKAYDKAAHLEALRSAVIAFLRGFGAGRRFPRHPAPDRALRPIDTPPTPPQGSRQVRERNPEGRNRHA